MTWREKLTQSLGLPVFRLLCKRGDSFPAHKDFFRVRWVPAHVVIAPLPSEKVTCPDSVTGGRSLRICGLRVRMFNSSCHKVVPCLLTTAVLWASGACKD